jgi:hypothetical protein
MVTMVDEIFDRHYQAARRELHASFREAFRSVRAAIRDAFEVLVGIEYQSPWTARTRRAR